MPGGELLLVCALMDALGLGRPRGASQAGGWLPRAYYQPAPPARPARLEVHLPAESPEPPADDGRRPQPGGVVRVVHVEHGAAVEHVVEVGRALRAPAADPH